MVIDCRMIAYYCNSSPRGGCQCNVESPLGRLFSLVFPRLDNLENIHTLSLQMQTAAVPAPRIRFENAQCTFHTRARLEAFHN